MAKSNRRKNRNKRKAIVLTTFIITMIITILLSMYFLTTPEDKELLSQLKIPEVEVTKEFEYIRTEGRRAIFADHTGKEMYETNLTEYDIEFVQFDGTYTGYNKVRAINPENATSDTYFIQNSGKQYKLQSYDSK